MSDLERADEFLTEDELQLDRAFSTAMDPPPPSARRTTMPPLPRHTLPLPLPPLQSSQRPRDRGDREQMPFRPGEVLLGKYQVERLMGSSGVAVVALVRHTDLGQAFLLKCLPPEAAAVPEVVSAFLRGARDVMRLQSEHTLRTIDAGRIPSGAPYVVTEAVAGSDLREVLRVRGALSITEAVDFVLQAAEAVAEAHAVGLAHKNLSPGSLFATRRPDGSTQIKVQDFGVGDALRSDAFPLRSSFSSEFSPFENKAVDALVCLAPEQIRGLSDVDARTDVWAFGAILHQLISGQPVYSAASIPALLASIAADSPMPITSLRAEVPANLEAAILRCLEKERSGRYPSLADFAAAIAPFGSVDAQSSVERITRTLGRGGRNLSSLNAGSALIHVGPAMSSAASNRASTQAKRSAKAPSELRYPLLWSTLLVAFGLVGGTIAGVLFATRAPLANRSIEQRIDSQKPESEEPASLLNPPEAQAPAQTPSKKDSHAPSRAPNRGQAPKSSAASQAVASGEVDETDLAPAAPKTATRAPAAPSSATPAKSGVPASASLGGDLFDSVR